MFEFLEKYIMGPMTKFSQKKLIRAIAQAGMASISFTIVGSFFLILNVLPDVIPALKGFYDSTMVNINDVYMAAYNATMGIIALYFLLVIGFEYTRIIRDEEDVNISPVTGMLLCVFGFFILLPQFTNKNGLHFLNDPKNGIINGRAIGSAPSRMGAVGIFTTIIVSGIVVNIYKSCVKKNLVIKMPDSVPEGVANSFTALIPAFFVAISFVVVNGILNKLGTDVFDAIAIPFGFVSNLTSTWGGILVIFFLISVLRLVGIHGATIISSLITPMVLYNMQQNNAGACIPLAGEFPNAYVALGGSGATLVLTFLMAFTAKSDQLRMVGKAELAPAIFNINEPIIFGLPIVYNPDFAIPFIVAPMADASLAYFAIKTGLVRPNIAMQPWPTPVGIGAFIGSGGDRRAAVLALLCALLAGLIYYPFFKRADNKLYKEQVEKEKEVEKAEDK